jgi:hypothetical protein
MNTDNDTYTAGSRFGDFLLEEGLLYEAQTVAMKKVFNPISPPLKTPLKSFF